MERPSIDEKQEQKFRSMTEQPVSRLICRLALPCIISMLVTSFYNMADTFFVGKLDSAAGTFSAGRYSVTKIKKRVKKATLSMPVYFRYKEVGYIENKGFFQSGL